MTWSNTTFHTTTAHATQSAVARRAAREGLSAAKRCRAIAVTILDNYRTRTTSSTPAGVGTKHDHHEGDSCGRPSEKGRRTARCDTSQIEGEENEQCEREHARDEARG